MPNDGGLAWGAKAAHEEFATSGKALNRPSNKPKEREPSLDDFRLEGESNEAAQKRFRGISKRNINAILERRPASASEIGVEARWLRRFKEHGLSYVSSASKEKLTILADYFSLPSYLYLWREYLIDSMSLSQSEKDQRNTSMNSVHSKLLNKLEELLDSGRYDHLIQLIDDLYKYELNRSAREEDEKKKAEAQKDQDIFVELI
ncbi:MAG: hypothetical protein CME33_17760 [Gimesia sp.]|uniref:hypothetical protein n=1 Tax=Gimesia sp. TaxID=2024833 RepID=UPI000C4E4BD9|nr:hypothetical protein [Gimesia sp.]MAX38404.1 hypothetical protein [Gimesia sp.]|tara:strand:- start:6694 stop:7305 length:612 start_codon:yes stop_codon:yes gene_type:complete